MEALPDDLTRAIGRVTVAATQLELQLMQVMRWIDDRDWDWAREQLSKSGGARRAIERAFETVPDHPQRAAVQALFDEASELLDGRNRIVHDPIVTVERPGYNGYCRYWMKENQLHPVGEADTMKLALAVEALNERLVTFRRNHLVRPTDSYQLGPNQPTFVP